MSLRIKRLEIQKHRIGLPEHRHDVPVRTIETSRRRIQTGRHARRVRLLEQLRHLSGLQHRLSPGRGDPAVRAPVGPEAERLREDLRRFHLERRRTRPRVGIVAVAATERTAAQKRDEPHARSVDRAEGLE